MCMCVYCVYRLPSPMALAPTSGEKSSTTPSMFQMPCSPLKKMTLSKTIHHPLLPKAPCIGCWALPSPLSFFPIFLVSFSTLSLSLFLHGQVQIPTLSPLPKHPVVCDQEGGGDEVHANQ